MGTCIQNPLSGIPSSQFSNFSGTSIIDVDIPDSLSYRTSHGTEEKKIADRAVPNHCDTLQIPQA
jgi:hypothetical protein